jgi:hypothetical protein
MKIGLGKELTRIAFDPNHPYRLANEAEVLSLCPELRQTEQPANIFPFDLTNPTLREKERALKAVSVWGI